MEEKPLTPISTPLKPMPKSSVKLLITTLIIVIVLVVTSTVFYFIGKTQSTNRVSPTPTTTPTTTPPSPTSPVSTWKTYLNIKYNYSIDYLSNWVLSEYSNSQNGASFSPLSTSNNSDTSSAISIAVGKTLLNYTNQTLEEYAKIAGSEIENHNSLASFKKIITSSGVVGYKTTWMVQGRTINGQPPMKGESESLPITYFEIPGNKTEIIRVELQKKEYLETYETMLSTIKIMPSLTPIPTIDEVAILKHVIKKYIALKHSSNESALTISVSKIEGNYAQGGASDEGGGGMWLAIKEGGAWVLVWDGNGTIECSTFTLYPNFPTSMIPECYDSAKQDVVKR